MVVSFFSQKFQNFIKIDRLTRVLSPNNFRNKLIFFFETWFRFLPTTGHAILAIFNFMHMNTGAYINLWRGRDIFLFSGCLITLSVSKLEVMLFIYCFTALCLAFAAFSVSWSCSQSVGLLGRGISPSQGRYLHRATQTQNKRTQTSPPEYSIAAAIWTQNFPNKVKRIL
jgi:hypothetical protein